MEDGGAEGGELDLQSRRGREAKIIIHELGASRGERASSEGKEKAGMYAERVEEASST